MSLFLEATALADALDRDQQEICVHYEAELHKRNSSFVDLMLEKVNQNAILKKWYILMLLAIQSNFLANHVSLDNNCLNGLEKLKVKFKRPISVRLLNSLINDILWVLDKEGIIPSKEFPFY
mgnify:CR=1 FL=1